MKIKLAEALLRRKELQQKVDRLKPINKEGLFEFRAERTKVSDSLDDVKASVPKVSLQQVTAAYDYYAKHLRKIDAVIQQSNWTVEVDADPHAMEDFIDPYVKDK